MDFSDIIRGFLSNKVNNDNDNVIVIVARKCSLQCSAFFCLLKTGQLIVNTLIMEIVNMRYSYFQTHVKIHEMIQNLCYV